MSNDTLTPFDGIDASMQRIMAAGSVEAAERGARTQLVDDARHIERGLVALIKQALDAGKLDADDAASMLPLVRRVIEGNAS